MFGPYKHSLNPEVVSICDLEGSALAFPQVSAVVCNIKGHNMFR